jgi:hypothetical protein
MRLPPCPCDECKKTQWVRFPIQPQRRAGQGGNVELFWDSPDLYISQFPGLVINLGDPFGVYRKAQLA